jgi:hypothetical protein
LSEGGIIDVSVQRVRAIELSMVEGVERLDSESKETIAPTIQQQEVLRVRGGASH